jgi:hypothetical protein
MPEYYARASELAMLLITVGGVTVCSDPPGCNAFVVYLEGDRNALLAARDRVRDERGIVLFETRPNHPNLRRSRGPLPCRAAQELFRRQSCNGGV